MPKGKPFVPFTAAEEQQLQELFTRIQDIIDQSDCQISMRMIERQSGVPLNQLGTWMRRERRIPRFHITRLQAWVADFDRAYPGGVRVEKESLPAGFNAEEIAHKTGMAPANATEVYRDPYSDMEFD